MKFEAEGQEFAKFLRSIEQCIQTVKGQYNFWQQNAFLTWSWRFLTYDRLEQYKFKLERFIGIYKHAGKVIKINLFDFLNFQVC